MPASVNCDPTEGQRCWLVSAPFLTEHKDLLIENIRLKHALADCQRKGAP